MDAPTLSPVVQPVVVESAPVHAPANDPVRHAAEPRPAASTSHDIPWAEAGNYLGRRVQVRTADGRTIFGTLTESRLDALVLEREMSSGTLTFELSKNEVESLRTRS